MSQIDHPAPWINPKWYEPFSIEEWESRWNAQAAKARRVLQSGAEPRMCSECKRGFLPETPQQITCGEEKCKQNRRRKLDNERNRLKRMLAESEQRRKEARA